MAGVIPTWSFIKEEVFPEIFDFFKKRRGVKMRLEKITWKKRCPQCKNYYLKDNFHGLSGVCKYCKGELKRPKPQCNAKTRDGKRCKKSVYTNGYCRQHYKKIFGKSYNPLSITR